MSEESYRLTRRDIERLCILAAIPSSGCTVGELTGRLGLSDSLTPAVEEAVAALAGRDLVQVREGFVVRTASGSSWLERETHFAHNLSRSREGNS